MAFTFDFISDIHREWWKDEAVDYAAEKHSDLLIVGGDLASKTEDSVDELKKIAGFYKTVLFVDGNHEFRQGPAANYDYNFDFPAVEDTLRKGIAEIPNAVYLSDRFFIQNGFAVIGRNGHWDYELVQGVTKEQSIKAGALSLKTDFNNAASFASLARRDFDALQRQVRALNEDPLVHTIIVVTHTVPRVELINFSPAFPLEHQMRMGAGVMKELQKNDTEGKIRLWLYGHQHDVKSTEIDGILYHQNSRGFPNDGVTEYHSSSFSVTPAGATLLPGPVTQRTPPAPKP